MRTIADLGQRVRSAWRHWWVARGSPWRRAAHSFRRRGGQDLLTLAAVLGLFALVVTLLDHAGFRVQHTASLPKGIYQVVPSDSPAELLRPGAIGLWCLPPRTARWAAARGYLRPGSCATGVEPLAKVVLAMEGDTVDFDSRGVRVSDRPIANSKPLGRDVAGRALPLTPYGRYVLRAGEAWIWSPYSARSFDSRYLGPLSGSALVAIVRPVWIIGSNRERETILGLQPPMLSTPE